MKRRAAMFCLPVAACMVMAASAQRQTPSSKEQELIRLETDWNAAFLRKDAAFFTRVMAAEYVVTYGDGSRGDRAVELQQLDASDEQIQSSSPSDFHVKLYGDTAVVLFSLHSIGTRHGQPLDATFRYMDVFVRRDRRWQCVASQNTRIGPI
jgi:ketosteroid isomerase-like protein